MESPHVFGRLWFVAPPMSHTTNPLKVFYEFTGRVRAMMELVAA